MASLGFDSPGNDVAALRQSVLRSARLQRARRVLVAACLCAFVVIMVATALLFQLV